MVEPRFYFRRAKFITNTYLCNPYMIHLQTFGVLYPLWMSIMHTDLIYKT